MALYYTGWGKYSTFTFNCVTLSQRFDTWPIRQNQTTRFWRMWDMRGSSVALCLNTIQGLSVSFKCDINSYWLLVKVDNHCSLSYIMWWCLATDVALFHRAVPFWNVWMLKTNSAVNVNYRKLTAKCTDAAVMATLLCYASAPLPHTTPHNQWGWHFTLVMCFSCCLERLNIA